MSQISIPDHTDTGDPSAQGGTIGALVAAFIALLVALRVNLTADQTAAILGFVAVVAPLATAALIRRRAWKPATVAATVDAVEQAVHDGPPEDLSTYEPDITGRAVMGVTSDPTDPRLTHGADEAPTTQADVYLVLSEEERAKGFVRPVRTTYRHTVCGTTTTMGQAIAETYAANPRHYGATFCVACSMHRPVGANGEFEWLDGTKVGT